MGDIEKLRGAKEAMNELYILEFYLESLRGTQRRMQQFREGQRKENPIAKKSYKLQDLGSHLAKKKAKMRVALVELSNLNKVI